MIVYHSLKERVYMDKIPTLKLTPIEPGDLRIEQKSAYKGVNVRPLDEAQAGEYQISEELRRALEESPGKRLTSRVRSFASSSAAKVRTMTKRRSARAGRSARTSRFSVRHSGSGRTSRAVSGGEGGEKKSRPPFVTTLQGQIAVCSGVILLALALKAVDTPKTQAVSATVEQAITTETNLDQNLGRLQFVQNMFSESVAVFWQQKAPETLQSPFNGRVNARYSITSPGIEITGRAADVFACYDGKVTAVDEDDEGNVAVMIEHTGGLATVYGRLSQADVKINDKVKKGDRIGGAQEIGEGYAMFLQVRLDDLGVDPLPYFQK